MPDIILWMELHSFNLSTVVAVHCDISLGFAQKKKKTQVNALCDISFTVSIPIFLFFSHWLISSHDKVPGCVRWASLSRRHASATLSLIKPQDVHFMPQMSHSSCLFPSHLVVTWAETKELAEICFARGNKDVEKQISGPMHYLVLPLIVT